MSIQLALGSCGCRGSGLRLSLHALRCRMYQDILGITDPAPDVVVSPPSHVVVCIGQVTAALKLSPASLSHWATVELCVQHVCSAVAAGMLMPRLATGHISGRIVLLTRVSLCVLSVPRRQSCLLSFSATQADSFEAKKSNGTVPYTAGARASVRAGGEAAG